MTEPNTCFTIEGILVAGPATRVRVLVDSIALDLERESVASLERMPAIPGLRARLAKPVRLHIRCGARLLSAGSAQVYHDVIWERAQPFTLRSRASDAEIEVSAGYHALEQAFIERLSSGHSGTEGGT